jgi:hypothetical protein
VSSTSRFLEDGYELRGGVRPAEHALYTRARVATHLRAARGVGEHFVEHLGERQ